MKDLVVRNKENLEQIGMGATGSSHGNGQRYSSPGTAPSSHSRLRSRLLEWTQP